MEKDILNIGLAQIAPVWMNKAKTIEKIIGYIKFAAEKSCDLIVFGEALLPGYPFWLTKTDGAKFNSNIQKEIFSKYFKESIQIGRGDLKDICDSAKDNRISIYLGMIERAEDRGNHSLYCTLAYIDPNGGIRSTHRKLVPTYEERLVWSHGDGNGLQVHNINEFTVGGLNCWENWMPLARSSLYAQGEDLHIAVWPGNRENTKDITRFIAMEARSFVTSVSSILRKEDIDKNIPYFDLIVSKCEDILFDGGSCVSAPNGTWIVEPVVNKELLITATIDMEQVRQERQNLDISGHYSRPDVTHLTINRSRQRIVDLIDYEKS